MEVQERILTHGVVYEMPAGVVKPLHGPDFEPGEQRGCFRERVWWGGEVLTLEKVE